MLNNNYFFHHTFKKLIIAFGKSFDQIYIRRRYNEGAPANVGQEYNQILVPIQYSPKEKWLVRKYQNPELEKENVSVVLPRMGFEITSITYDSERKLQSLGRNVHITSSTAANVQYNPVPYNIGITLTILSDSADDATQIVEQIIPFFRPEYTLAIEEIPELNIVHDIPMALLSINTTDTYESEYLGKRILTWSLDFNIKAYFFGAIKVQSVIKKAQTDIHIVPSSDGPITQYDEEHTPRHVRTIVAIEPITAGPEDDFNFSEVTQLFDDNKKYNPHTRQDEEIV